MAIVVHLLEKEADVGQNYFDGIRAMVVAIDDIVDTTSALILARGSIILQANGVPVPDDYFDTERLITGVWDAADDFTAIDGENVLEVIA
jgi:hypothetical protein